MFAVHAPAATITGNTSNLGAPGPIGSTTPNSGSFTTLSVSGLMTVGANNGKFAFPCAESTIIGNGAGALRLTDTFTSDDTMIGYHAGLVLAPGAQTHMTLIGSNAGSAVVSGGGGTAIGQKSLISATTIVSSVAVGGKSGLLMVAPTDDTFIGYSAGGGGTLTNIGRRVFVGYSAGMYDNGDNNIAIGYAAGANTIGTPNPTTGWQNIAIGSSTLNKLNGGTRNVVIGHQAASALTTGVENMAIGYQAGNANITGSYNIYLGAQAGFSHTSSFCIFIGNGAGNNAPVASQNLFIAGGDGHNGQDSVNNVFFGKGYAHATPTAYAINGTGGSGTDIAGADVNIAGGKGTGAGATGKVNVQTAPVSGSSSTLNTLVNAAQFDATTTAGQTRFLLYDVDNATLERVTVGAADSGGAGFKVLRIPN